MVNQVTQNHFPRQVDLFKSNESILLNDPQTVWLVQSGSVDVFSVTLQDGEIESHRHYLFSCEPGSALFGTASSHTSVDRQILAVAQETVELAKIDAEYFAELAASSEVDTAELTKRWLNRFNSRVFDTAAPTIQVEAAEAGYFSLTKGQNWQPAPDTLLWVEVKEGVVFLLGQKELVITAEIKSFPVTHSFWLESHNTVQFNAKTTGSIKDAECILSGLSIFHGQFLFFLQHWTQEKRAIERERLNKREQLDRQVTAEALAELTSPIMPHQTTDVLIGEDPLLAAAGAVGKALGMEINPPSQSEDLQHLDNPLLAIARASRLRMRQVLLRDNWWQQDCGPLVGYLQQDEESLPVALLQASNGSYEIYNSTAQNRIVVNANVAREIEPMAYMFYRSFADKALNILDIVKFALTGRVKDLLIIVFSSIVVTLLGMLTPQATAILIDSAIPASDRASIVQIGFGLAIVALAKTAFRITKGFSLLRVETSAAADTQAAMWDRLLNLPVSFFRQYQTGDLLSRISSINAIRQKLGTTVLLQLITSIFAVLNLGLLFYYSVSLSWIAIGSAIVIITVTSVSGAVMVRKVRPLLEIKGHLFGEVVQLINGISKLRVAGAEQRAFAFWSHNYSQQIKLELSTQLFEDVVAVLNTVIPTITTGLIFWFAVVLLDKAQMGGEPGLTVGTFVAFNGAFGAFLGGATQVSNIFTDALQIVPQWERAQPIVQTLPEVQLDKADPGRLSGKITLDRVSFRYNPEIPLTLKDVSINAEPGEFIALVGTSGSGKSTIFRLLLGFETPEDGSIYYDGQDLSGLNVNAVRRQLGVVLQNGKIMSGSIFDNLAGNTNVTLDEAWSAARMAGFDRDVKTMPMGMHTVVSEGGGNFSGGQRQRLLIAKALILKPRILLFDEATSALDNETQAIVSHNLDQTKVTRIVIAHRLSTIRNADRIYVLDKGNVLQQGTFAELSAREGRFADLIKRQIA